MKQILTLKFENPNALANLGKMILSKWPSEITEVNFDPGNPGLNNPEEKRVASLQFACPNTVSGEVIMLSIHLPGVKIEMQQL